VSPRKRRGPVLGNRPSHTSHDSTTTTAFEGPSLSLSSQWIPYDEDSAGDYYESPEAAFVPVAQGAPPRKVTLAA
jgi:hypothetical protein